MCIATLTVAVRVAYMIVFATWDFKHEWAFGYEMGRLGHGLYQGNGFTLDGTSPTARFPPAYPLLVGAVFYVFGPYTSAAAVALFVFQSLCSSLSGICLALLGYRFVGQRTATLVGFAWAFYPTSVFYSAVRIWYSELAVLLVLLAITIAVSGAVSPFRRMLLLGALSGVGILTDSTLVLYLPLLALWLLLSRPLPLSKIVVSLMIWSITAGVIMSPWILRNWLVLGSPNPLKSNFGTEVFFGNNPGTKSWAEIEQEFSVYRQRIDQAEASVEVAFSRYLRNKAIEGIRENPTEFVASIVRRVWQFWIYNSRPGSYTWLRVVYFGPILVLALYGLRYAVARSRPAIPIWLFVLVYPIPYYLIHVENGRYSYPVEPLMLLLAIVSLAVSFKYVINDRVLRVNTRSSYQLRLT